MLTLRDELSAGTLRSLARPRRQARRLAEDRWQRRVEFLFERLAVRWEIAGLPLEGQKELLGRYRLAGSSERQQVRETLAEHLAAHHPEIERLIGSRERPAPAPGRPWLLPFARPRQRRPRSARTRAQRRERARERGRRGSSTGAGSAGPAVARGGRAFGSRGAGIPLGARRRRAGSPAPPRPAGVARSE